jgi:hypothetical protein
MAPIRQLTDLVFYVGHLVGVGDRVYDHDSSADQQPYCILGEGQPTCQLEDIPE